MPRKPSKREQADNLRMLSLIWKVTGKAIRSRGLTSRQGWHVLRELIRRATGPIEPDGRVYAAIARASELGGDPDRLAKFMLREAAETQALADQLDPPKET